ncbi:hypothetical protein, partial [Phocaeicola sartorii]|uniref:hypothetical protein n=1 Tax=Phocaeicola sartorii TaxID=671267 RepID=UPI0025974D53
KRSAKNVFLDITEDYYNPKIETFSTELTFAMSPKNVGKDKGLLSMKTCKINGRMLIYLKTINKTPNENKLAFTR